MLTVEFSVDETVGVVGSWLQKAGLSSQLVNGDYLVAVAPVSVANELLNTKYFGKTAPTHTPSC